MTDGLKLIGFICDWSVNLKPFLNEQRQLRAMPSVHIVPVPCSGFVRAEWLEDALTRGADGVFVTGCPYGDCVNREGNYLMRDRIEQLQRRIQRRRVDAARIGMLAHGFHDFDAFLTDVRAFAAKIAQLKPVAPARPVMAQPSRTGGGGSA